MKLLHGDCLDIMPTIESGSVDMILCDLPYGTTACKWDTIIPFAPLWEQYKRIIKPRGAIVLTASQPFTSALVMSNPKWFRYEWIWKKRRITGYLNARIRPMSSHESILVFGDGRIPYFPRMKTGIMHKSGAKPEWGGQAKCYGDHKRIFTESDQWYPRSIIEFGADHETTITRTHRPDKIFRHPTQKPVALMEYMIRTYTNAGETVLDNCFGSGTTGVACVNTGREFIGIEKDASYFEIARKRIESTSPLFSEVA